MANAACDRLSELAWEAQEFGQYSMHKAFYRTIRDEFPLSAQVVVRLNSKVADAYKIDQKSQREFRKHGSICYDPRILSWKMDQSFASIWTRWFTSRANRCSFLRRRRTSRLADFVPFF